MIRALAAAAGSLALLAATPARAGDDPRTLLDAGAQAIENVDFEAARGDVDRALASGRLTPGQLVRAHRLAGEIAAALDDSEGARAHFLRWILLDHGAALPAGMSPKITEPFAAARGEAAGLGGFAVSVRLERSPGRVRVTVERRDPLTMIAKLSAQLRGGAVITVSENGAAFAVADTAAADVDVVALDEQGNQLVVATASSPAAVVASRRRFPTLVRWPTWTVVAVVAAGTGGLLGWRVRVAEDDLRALNADSSQHSFDEARAIQDRGRRDALLANLSYGVAGAAAVAAVLTYLLEPRGVELRPTAGVDGAGATATVRF